MGDVLVSKSIFTPSLEETPSAASIREVQEGRARSEDFARRKISGEGVRLQVTQVRVTNGLQGGIFGWGAATGVYLVTSVVDGVGSDPISFQGKVYQGIINGMSLPLGVGGERTEVFTVYFRQAPLPQVLSFSVLVLRSNEALRDMGSAINEVLGDPRFQTLSGIVKTAVTGLNPAYGIIWQAAQEAIGLLGERLSHVADTQLGYYVANYTNLFDDLGKGHHPPGRRGATMQVDKVALGYQIDVL